MEADDAIRSILKSYELPGALEDRLAAIAKRRCDELFVYSFDGQYRLIAKLVDRFTRSATERRTQSLETVPQDTYATRQPAPGEHRLAERTNARQAGYTWREAMAVLHQRLPKAHYRFLRHLVYQSERRPPISKTGVARQARKVQARLQQIAGRYQFANRILIPARPIQAIRFDPLRIAFGYRDYDGNPLRYYLEHDHLYDGITRTQLASVDVGLYKALQRAGQMHEAIPHFRKGGRTPRSAKNKAIGRE